MKQKTPLEVLQKLPLDCTTLRDKRMLDEALANVLRDEAVYRRFICNVHILLGLRNLTVTKLADMTGVDASHISRIINGHGKMFSFLVLRGMAEALQADFLKLLVVDLEAVIEKALER